MKRKSECKRTEIAKNQCLGLFMTEWGFVIYLVDKWESVFELATKGNAIVMLAWTVWIFCNLYDGLQKEDIVLGLKVRE
jgi:uncharacterized membrane protein YiaA